MDEDRSPAPPEVLPITAPTQQGFWFRGTKPSCGPLPSSVARGAGSCQANQVHDPFCSAFLSAASSAFRDLNLAGLTKLSTQGGSLYFQLSGEFGPELVGDP